MLTDSLVSPFQLIMASRSVEGHPGVTPMDVGDTPRCTVFVPWPRRFRSKSDADKAYQRMPDDQARFRITTGR